MRYLPLALVAVFSLAFTACSEESQVPTEPNEIAQPSTPSFSVLTTLELTFDYGDFPSLDKAGVSFPQRWDVTACELTLSYGVAMTGSSGWQPISVGLRDPTSVNDYPNMYPHGEAGWMEAIPQWAASTDDNLADLDDHFLLVGHGWNDDEKKYNSRTPGTTEAAFGSWDSYAFWFDRDGVDQWQATHWNYKDGITYNTLGDYAVSVLYTQVGSSPIEATMFATINGEDQGFYSDGYQSTDPPEIQPVGRSFTVFDLSDLRVFAGSDGGGPVTDLTVTGCLVLESGMATGGGWFIPEPSNAFGLTLDGAKATFGFNAKRKNDESTGHLEFQYHGDGLTLNSSSYDWVTLATTQVMFEGIGTVNGEPGFRFRVRAVDGDKIGTGTDRFEIRIWTGQDNFDSPTYRAEGDLGGGQIVVRKK